jgi:hypothetical protein
MNFSLSFAFRFALAFLFVSAIAAFTVHAADSGWAGEYSDQNFNGGKSVFQLTIEQSGGAIQVSFDAAHKDAHGAAPEGQGPAKASGKDMLTFKFEDSFSNSGTGTIKRAGTDIIVSMKTTHVADPRCLVFYRDNMRLKSAKKK